MFNGAIRTVVKDSNLSHIGRDQINVYNIAVDHPRGIVYASDDGTLHHLPLEQVHIKASIVDGDVTLVNFTLCCVLTHYNSLCMFVIETDIFQFL
jgi:hypothetical protein